MPFPGVFDVNTRFAEEQFRPMQAVRERMSSFRPGSAPSFPSIVQNRPERGHER